MKAGSPESKFKLDGHIETPTESMYIIDQLKLSLKQATKRMRFLALAVSVLILTVVALALKYYQTHHKLEQAQSMVDQNAILIIQSDSLESKIDSLLQVTLKLKSENELLVENSNRLDGIFFEVLVGGFEDFNLARYLEDLATFRHEQYDGSIKLVLGRFRSFRKALLFENDLKRIGLKDVSIVGRIEGVLVPFKEALEAGQNQNK